MGSYFYLKNGNTHPFDFVTVYVTTKTKQSRYLLLSILENGQCILDDPKAD